MKEKAVCYFSSYLLLLTVAMCYGEVFSIFTGKMTEVTVIHTPIWVKGLKDLGFLVLGFLGLLSFNFREKAVRWGGVYVFCVVVLFGISFSGNRFFALAGLRWILPLTACLMIAPHINRSFLVRISGTLTAIFCIHFLIQLVQVYYNLNIDSFGIEKGGIFLGFLDRPPGIFLMPNTASFFSVLTWFFMGQFLSDKKIGRLKYLIPVSILLNKSGTGYVTFFCVVILEHISKISWKMVVGTVLSSVVMLLFLEYFLNRPELIVKSLGIRMNIIFQSLLDAELISTKFGYGSITAVLLARNFHISDPVPILDSTWSAVLVNCGLIPFLLIITFFLYAAYFAHRSNRMDMLTFLFILFCFGTTNSLFEAFPMNFLCPVLGIYYVSEAVNEKAPTADDMPVLHSYA